MPNYTTKYTGQQITDAVGKALMLDDIEYAADEVISGKVYHVLWKVKPTSTNNVFGSAFDPETGEQMVVQSENENKTIKKISDINTIANSEIEKLF